MCSILETVSKEQWFHGLLPREDVIKMLTNVGDFLLRTSETVAGQPRHLIFSVQVSAVEDGAKHYVVNSTEEGKCSVSENRIFDSIFDLIETYKTIPIDDTVPGSKLINPILRQPWELSHDDITLTKTLGEGAFGEVKKGTLQLSDGIVDVAVKVAKLEKCTKEQIKEIMNEARLMRNFDHKNIVRCYGVAARTEPLYVVMELVSGGGLDSYLQKNKATLNEKLDIINQVARGICYLHQLLVIHRDIAARNVLYGNSVAKVSDFGLSRSGTVYKMNPKNKVPVKWMAPETLQFYTYTQQSDIFSFGILIWEVFENGNSPYPGMSVLDVHTKVTKEDYRMAIPSDAPPEVEDILKKMWLTKPQDRPDAQTIVSIFSKLVATPVILSDMKTQKPGWRKGGKENAARNKWNPLKTAMKKGNCSASPVDSPAVSNEMKMRNRDDAQPSLEGRVKTRAGKNYGKSKTQLKPPNATLKKNVSKEQLQIIKTQRLNLRKKH